MSQQLYDWGPLPGITTATSLAVGRFQWHWLWFWFAVSWINTFSHSLSSNTSRVCLKIWAQQWCMRMRVCKYPMMIGSSVVLCSIWCLRPSCGSYMYSCAYMGTKLMAELTVDLKCWRSSPTFVHTIVHLNPKWCECKSCVVLTNVFTELIGLWHYCHKEVSELLWWGAMGSSSISLLLQHIMKSGHWGQRGLYPAGKLRVFWEFLSNKLSRNPLGIFWICPPLWIQ